MDQRVNKLEQTYYSSRQIFQNNASSHAAETFHIKHGDMSEKCLRSREAYRPHSFVGASKNLLEAPEENNPPNAIPNCVIKEER